MQTAVWMRRNTQQPEVKGDTGTKNGRYVRNLSDCVYYAMPLQASETTSSEDGDATSVDASNPGAEQEEPGCELPSPPTCTARAGKRALRDDHVRPRKGTTDSDQTRLSVCTPTSRVGLRSYR
ncbi:hypothetical protein E5288_WYG001189 [Bos mutus]|uniref:Uncharacterized protein n=1 Tax=Bos mutus TaxID=72004 RepID=A0A6B0RXP4_9CETA|nr:hypothetical protein [Bos mutus]